MSIDLEWKKPEEQTYGRHSYWADVVSELKKRPGQWAVGPREYATPKAATTMAGIIRLKFPGVETACRARRIHVRWVGEDAK